MPFPILAIIFFILPVAAVLYVLAGIRVISEWERRPVLFLGKFSKIVGPGLVWQPPILYTYLDPVQVRETVAKLEVPNVQTMDNVPISFKLVLTSKVDATKVKEFTINVEDGTQATFQRALAAVTDIVGKKPLDSILHHRDEISSEVQTSLRDKVLNWGVMITAVEIKDIKITDQSIEQAIAMKARAGKEAEAELVRAEMQTKIAHALVEAADAMTDQAWRLKGLETIIEMTRSANNNTVLIGTDLLKGISDVIPDGAETAKKVLDAAVGATASKIGVPKAAGTGTDQA